MATASLTPPMNLWVVLSESKRIINAHSRHFLALSVLFLLPLYFTSDVYQYVVRHITGQSAASHNSVLVSLLRGFHHDDQPSPVLLLLLYLIAQVVSTVFTLLAIGSITYSVFQGFHGRPVKLISAVKSSFTSFFPLLATLISTNFIMFGILLILGFAAFLLINLIKLILPDLEFHYSVLPVIVLVVMILWIVIIIKLAVNWILSWVVVVLESVWGFTPLKRSKSLIKGMKGVSLSLFFLFIVTQLVLVWINSVELGDNETGKLWTNAFFMLWIVITSAFQMLLTLYQLAATTVMYIYCKTSHGEIASETAEGFEREYVSLPFDDGKVPQLNSEAYNNVYELNLVCFVSLLWVV